MLFFENRSYHGTEWNYIWWNWHFWCLESHEWLVHPSKGFSVKESKWNRMELSDVEQVLWWPVFKLPLPKVPETFLFDDELYLIPALKFKRFSTIRYLTILLHVHFCRCCLNIVYQHLPWSICYASFPAPQINRDLLPCRLKRTTTRIDSAPLVVSVNWTSKVDVFFGNLGCQSMISSTFCHENDANI